MRRQSPLTIRGTGGHIHAGPGNSISNQRPNFQTRMNPGRSICLADRGSPHTLRPVVQRDFEGNLWAAALDFRIAQELSVDCSVRHPE